MSTPAKGGVALRWSHALVFVLSILLSGTALALTGALPGQAATVTYWSGELAMNSWRLSTTGTITGGRIGLGSQMFPGAGTVTIQTQNGTGGVYQTSEGNSVHEMSHAPKAGYHSACKWRLSYPEDPQVTGCAKFQN